MSPKLTLAKAQSVRGNREGYRTHSRQESNSERQLKYLDFIDIYADLDDNEPIIYQQLYAQVAAAMSGFAERHIQQGHEQGRQEGRQEGEATVLFHLLTRKFGSPNESVRQHVQSADAETFLRWSGRVSRQPAWERSSRMPRSFSAVGRATTRAAVVPFPRRVAEELDHASYRI